MRNAAIIGLLILSVFVASCSTNTQKQNTTIGAVSGAVVGGLAGSLVGGGTGKVIAIAGGAILGGLLGGYIGHSMDSADNSKLSTTLNNNAKGQTNTWKNPNTGARYMITPTTGWITVNGNPNCRKYRSVAMENGKKMKTRGIACRQTDGAWMIVKSKSN